MKKITKIAIINVANPNKTLSEYDTTFLSSDTIRICDYTGSNYYQSVEMLKKALRDKTITHIWSLSGGSQMIQMIRNKTKLYSSSRKIFIGSSDSTHLFINITDKNIIKKYYLHFSEIMRLNNKSLFCTALKHQQSLIVVKNEKKITIDLSKSVIIGGHSVISGIFLHQGLIPKTSRIVYLFWEHHYHDSDSVDDFRYWLEVLMFKAHELGITKLIFGRSKIHSHLELRQLTFEEQQYLVTSIVPDDFEIMFVDQTISPVTLYTFE